MKADKKLFLLDAMALIYRAYFALSKNPRITSKGMNTSAIFGFTNTLLELLTKEKPTHIAVAFDTAAPVDRQADFAEYKANRQETPEDIIVAIPYIKEIIRAFKIPILELDGYEADDVIGTIAKKAEQDGYQTYMVTSDKDFGQLVSKNIFIHKPPSFGNQWQTLGEEEVLKRWEIKNVEQVKDILGLMGDAVDNIPGVPGVGEKTAMKLVHEFGSVEGVIENADKLKGKLQENVKIFSEQALMSKKLATIICDVPIKVSEEELVMEEPDKEKLEKIFTELEFRAIGKRVLGEDFSVNVSKEKQTDLFGEESKSKESGQTALEPKAGKNISNTPHEYFLIDTFEKRKELIKKLEKQNEICFDTETTGLDPNNCEIVGLSFSFKLSEAYYIPFPKEFNEAKNILHEFKIIFENEKINKIGQNIKFDMLLLKWYGVEVKGKLLDTMLMHYLIEPDLRHGMDLLAETYLGYTTVHIDELIGKRGKNQLSMRDVPIEKIKDYAAEDADITFQLKEKLFPVLKETRAEEVFEKIESPLVYTLADMEFEGVKINSEFLNEYSKELEKDIIQTEKEVYELAGVRFNLASPKQLGDVLFEKLKIPYSGKKTKTGQYSTDEDTLNKLAGENEVVKKLLAYRELSKLKSTYVDALPLMVNPKTGRIHTSYNQARAATGRLSSEDPNLQNIPIRTDRGKKIRKAFIPRDKNYVLLSADYSQIELRIIAELSKDEAMLEAFKSGFDIHAATAAKVYGVKMEEVNADMRRHAKTVNFGIIYGISAFGLAQQLGISRTDAGNLINQYFTQYPKVKKYMDESINRAREKGYVETLLGRRRYLRDINSKNNTVRGYAERNAINAPIQGTAADMIKIAMVNIHQEFLKNNFKSKMILQVHDELVFDAHKSEVEKIKPIVEEKMKTAILLKVPVGVEVGMGENWLEAH